MQLKNQVLAIQSILAGQQDLIAEDRILLRKSLDLVLGRHDHKCELRISDHNAFDADFAHIRAPHHLDLGAVEIRTREESAVALGRHLFRPGAFHHLPVSHVSQYLQHVSSPHFVQALVDVILDLIFLELENAEFSLLFGAEWSWLLFLQRVLFLAESDASPQCSLVRRCCGLEQERFVLDFIGEDTGCSVWRMRTVQKVMCWVGDGGGGGGGGG